ncbi:MAG: hypothetical protein A2896_01275 [Candidatus Nealsonbacteria bacterium RIFCSPLOWO2_01_FULL_43_32]|uniref:Pilus assembly protein PilO n=1 Tax=Candidatus Nealsonbacteria bacterium RIFCSPLOWO2_01_FULL_43_32 TaxID=1801672 RepID=A0A1G2EGD8_9BACT|nr:MAG: hypothetical protein A2896_01275 [Candidatus Nealsonbacteria bacterium RIFCSPLOWO2_01_FULL_43_32]
MKMNKLIIMSVCLALALILGLTLAWPQYQALQVLRFNIQAKELELQSKQAYFSAVKETAQQLEGYGDVLAKIASALPETPSLPSLFNFLQSSASEHGLVLGEITLGSVDKGEILVLAKLIGDYPAFKNFLVALENSARIIEVENITFASPVKTTDSFTFTVQIKTHSY